MSDLDDLSVPEQAMFVMSNFPGLQGGEKFVLLTLAVYGGEEALGRLAELTGYSLQSTRNHLRQWETLMAVELDGSSRIATARFVGAETWRERWTNRER